eukprot:TRINITY_DN7567_c0_g1_i2.p1 TRINITY_DN7567_c0_g1~~TRINITY_DN7567_c0_g1_i2.p1  ORF type:complete len:471 (-),score=65.47 TRINITY_DN7567_c0_g1_i2:292-1704(-)
MGNTSAGRVAVCSACLLLQVGSQISTPLDHRGVDFEASSQWRVLNVVKVTYGWTIAELKFFSDAACSKELSSSNTSEAIASGYDPGSPPSRALDGKTFTEWRAQCYVCNEKEAWLGVRFDEPAKVLCVQLWQWGHREYSASSILVQRWDVGSATEEGGWRDVLRGESLGGSRWNEVKFVKCQDLAMPAEGTVKVTNRGYYPSDATFACNGIRLMDGEDKSVCGIDGTWSQQAPRCWAALELIAFITASFLLIFFWGFGYYRYVVLKKPPALESATFIPNDSLGNWTTPLMDECMHDQKPILQCLFCPCCRVADTWSQAGLLPYQFGVILQQMCCLCMPCVGAFFRQKLRRRFVIRRESSTTDFITWTFCPCCAVVQEAKHVDSLCVVAFEEEIAKIAAEKRKKEDEERQAEVARSLKKKQSVSFSGGQERHRANVMLSKENNQIIKAQSTLEMMQKLQGPVQQKMGDSKV